MNAEIYYPMLVSAKQGVKDVEEVILKRWEKFDGLPDLKRRLITSDEVVAAIAGINEQYRLGDSKVEELSRIVREIIFGEADKNQLVQIIIQRLGISEQRAAQEIANLIESRILSITPKPEEMDLSGLEQLSVAEAVRKFKGVGEQLISANPIKLRIFADPVRPSVKNWITDYQENLGVQKHEMMERGNYLFHSENTKRLTAGERQKVGIILKSLDDNSPILVNPEMQEVVFPKLEEEVRAVPAVPAQSGVRFSSPQTLSAERQSGGATQRANGNRL